jgi:YD repeat-containing protein
MSVSAGVNPGNTLNQVEEFDLTDAAQVQLFCSYNEVDCASTGCQLRSTSTPLFQLDKKESGSWTNQFAKSNSRPNSASDQPYYTQENFSDIVYLGPGHYRVSVWKVPGYSMRINALWTKKVKLAANSIEKRGGGIRVKAVSSYEGNKLLKKRTFIYTKDGTPAGESSGILFTQPQLGFISGTSRSHYYAGKYYPDGYATYGCFYDELSYAGRMSSSVNAPGFITKGTIGYSKVTEIVSSVSENGKTEYTYNNASDAYSYIPTLPATANALNGKPIATTYYNAQGVIVKQMKYTYQERELQNLLNAKVFPSPASNGSGQAGASGYELHEYKNTSSWCVLVSQQETTYGGTEPYTVTKSFAYDNARHKEISIENTSTSDGKMVAIYNYYPHDYSANTTDFIKAMQEAHISGSPVEQLVANADKGGENAQITGGKLISYYTGTKVGLPSKIWQLEAAKPIALSNFKFTKQASVGSILEAANRDSHYPTRPALQLTYTEQKQLQQQRLAADGVVSYLWGYNWTLPIAEIKNAAVTEFFYEGFEETNGAQTGQAHSGTRYWAGSYTVNWVRPNSRVYHISYWYRQGGQWYYKKTLYGSDPSFTLTGGDAYDDVCIVPVDAQLTTYTYVPLVGLTSRTGPEGRTIYYDYDDLGRLIRTRDEQGRILSQQQYHYAQP